MSEEVFSRHKPENVNQEHQQNLGMQDRVALGITNAIGTMYTVYFFALFMGGWMLWQGELSRKPFDPYPFAFLLFFSNVIQLLLMPLIMVGQNVQGRHSEIRSDEGFKTITTSYHNIENILAHLDDQDKVILNQTEILEELEKLILAKNKTKKI